ncbi:MAG: PmoA family protein, partial [Planctomycetota bacterium]
AAPFRVRQTPEKIVILRGEKSMLTYRVTAPPAPDGIDPIYRRSGYLHPVNTPQGVAVTEAFPLDHPHQHGVFTAWVRTSYDGKPVDFWNLAAGAGRVLHERVVSIDAASESAGFEVDLLHRVESSPPVDVLRERWKIRAVATDDSHFCFDLETTQSAITDVPLVVLEYHYGGVAFRGPAQWLSPADREGSRPDSSGREPSAMLNNLGSDRRQGNHQRARWIALTGQVDGRSATTAVLGHRDNFRAPQSARLHPTKPYFCFAPCVDGEFVIDREHPYRARFRYLVTDAAPDAEWLDQQWQSWCGE